MLNDVDDEHFSDAILNELIQEAYDEWFRRFADDNPRFARETLVTTYLGGYTRTILCQGYLDYDNLTADFSELETVTGAITGNTATIIQDKPGAGTTGRLFLNGADGEFQDDEGLSDGAGGAADADGTLVDICGGDEVPRISKILSVTQYRDGELIELAESPSLDEHLGGLTTSTESNYPLSWYYDHETEGSSTGAVNDKQVILLRPIPSSNLTLYVMIQREPPTLSADTSTTGLPSFVERPMIYQAAIAARESEESPNTRGLDKMLAKAEDSYVNAVDRYVTGPERIVYDEDLVW